MDGLGVARAAIGIVLMAWLPGYVWTRALLPDLAGLPRFVVAVLLSVALMMLALYGGNALLGIAVSGAHATWYSLLLTALAVGVLAARRWGPALRAQLEP